MAGSLHPSAADNEAERKRQEDARAAQAAARRAALARAEEAEAEAAAAAARVRAAQERAAADPPLEDPPEDRDEVASSLFDGPRTSVQAAIALQEATAVLHLHAQAVAVQNIRHLVRVVLDVTSGSFARWREQFLLALGKYSLQGHVLQDDRPLNSPD